MRFWEIMREDNSSKTYNWTGPVVVLRGSQRGETDPFKDIRLGAPFFTDSPTVAGGYSGPWRKGDETDIKGRVFRYRVKLNNPCILWHGEPESITEIGTIRERLNLNDEETIALYHSVQGWNRQVDDETLVAISKMPFEEITEDIGISSFWLASDTAVQQRAKAQGYDGLILRGPYTGDGHGSDEQGTSFDGVTALEWVVFNPASVKLLDPVPQEAEMAESADDDLDFAEPDDTQVTPADTFLHRLEGMTQPHPFNHRALILGGAMVEISKSVDDRAAGIHISDIMTFDAGKGHANAAMAAICKLADETKVTLDLTAKAYLKGEQARGKMTTPQLVKWYNRFGFVRAGGDDYDGIDMVRTPPMKIKLRGFARPH